MAIANLPLIRLSAATRPTKSSTTAVIAGFSPRRSYSDFCATGDGSGLVWVTVVSQADVFSPLFGRQAPVRELARRAREFAGPDGAMFSYDVRVCGFGFYGQRLIGIRATEADIVLPPTEEQRKRLIETPADCLRLAPGKPVCGIIMADRLGSVFPTNDWQVLGRAAGFSTAGCTEHAHAGLGVGEPEGLPITPIP